MWVSGRSGAPWKAFQGLENTEEKGGKCFREGPAKTLQKYDLLDCMRSAWYNRERYYLERGEGFTYENEGF